MNLDNLQLKFDLYNTLSLITKHIFIYISISISLPFSFLKIIIYAIIIFFLLSNNSSKMAHSKRRPQEQKGNACCCFMFSHAIRGIGRCLFVACYPALHCCGLDEHRHRHSEHHHRHFQWRKNSTKDCMEKLRRRDFQINVSYFIFFRLYFMKLEALCCCILESFV